MNLDVAGKVFLVTGGTGGLGLATARLLCAEGAHVFICGRDTSRLETALAEMGDQFGASRVAGMPADIGTATDRELLVEQALARWGRLDGLLNNAGGRSAAPLASIGPEQWSRDLEVKVVAAADLVRLSLDSLAESRGAVVNVLSTHARAPGGASLPSSASRAAGLALTKSTATEFAPRGVRVNAVLVGLIESGQWTQLDAAAERPEETPDGLAALRGVPMGRLGRAEEFADVAAFLLSPRSSYVTGAALNIDGGLCPVP